MASPKQVMTEYLDAFTSGPDGAEKARRYIADDFDFVGPMMQTRGADAFLAGAAGLGPIVRGYTMRAQVEEGDDVISVYDFHIASAGGGIASIAMAEWATIKNDQLVRSRLIFNVNDFESAMAPG